MGEVRVGAGVVIKNRRGEVLVGRRTTEHAPCYSIPGGFIITDTILRQKNRLSSKGLSGFNFPENEYLPGRFLVQVFEVFHICSKSFAEFRHCLFVGFN